MPDTANIQVFGELVMNGTTGMPVQVLPTPDANARRPLYVNTNLCEHSALNPDAVSNLVGIGGGPSPGQWFIRHFARR